MALGDSITDGHATTTNGNDRWTDDLAERLQAARATRKIGGPNEGIGGNQLLEYGWGPDMLARFDRDVLAQVGARWLICAGGGQRSRQSDAARPNTGGGTRGEGARDPGVL